MRDARRILALARKARDGHGPERLKTDDRRRTVRKGQAAEPGIVQSAVSIGHGPPGKSYADSKDQAVDCAGENRSARDRAGGRAEDVLAAKGKDSMAESEVKRREW